MRERPFFLLITILLSASVCFAQPVATDSLIFHRGMENVRKIHDKALEGSHLLYNGEEYFRYEPLVDEHPFFLSEEWVMGNVRYDGEFFADVPMLYDIAKGKLIVSNYANGNMLQLVEELVDEFSIESHHFVHLKRKTDSLTMKPGFYENLYGGKTQVLARRVKELDEKLIGYDRTRSFYESTQYFMNIGGHFIKVARKREVLRSMGSHQKELKIFIRQNNLFSENLESSFVRLAKYFDALNP